MLAAATSRPPATIPGKRIQTDIIAFLREQVKGRHVLDVGCCDHNFLHPPSRERWLHGHLAESAESIVGLDILEDDIKQMREAGYRAIAGDVCTVEIGEEFEVIVAGEIIEHVENPGQMIRNLARHLRPGGRLILTTPHPFFGLHMVESVFCDPRRRWHPQHVGWQDPFTIGNLLERCGLRVLSISYFTRSRKLLRLIRAGVPCWGWLASSICVIAERE